MTTTKRPRFTESDLVNARNWYYPGWWTHESEAPNPAMLPLYRIVVHDENERALAYASKPSYVVAEFEWCDE